MKFPNQFNFHKFFVISAITTGVGFFLFSLIFTRMVLSYPHPLDRK